MLAKWNVVAKWLLEVLRPINRVSARYGDSTSTVLHLPTDLPGRAASDRARKLTEYCTGVHVTPGSYKTCPQCHIRGSYAGSLGHVLVGRLNTMDGHPKCSKGGHESLNLQATLCPWSVAVYKALGRCCRTNVRWRLPMAAAVAARYPTQRLDDDDDEDMVGKVVRESSGGLS